MAGSPSVLLVEDDHFLSSLLRSRLEKEGVAVTQAFDGEEALNTLKTLKPSVIVLDVIMPKVSGFDILERIALDPRLHLIPVIAVSNLGQDSDMEKAKRLGAVDYLVKVKIPIDELVQKIKSLAK
ncbi:response regulator [Candidatus Parcubacteria bacterium]|nr:MAG: response regulator [Candidatus Parcubacteria bacterium]